MTRVLTILAAVSALAVTLAACGDDEDSSDSASGGGAATTEAATTTEETAPQAQAATGTTIKLGDSQFGPVVFDGDDQAIYIFDKETGPTSECYGECAAAWPPVLTKGEPQAAGGVKQNLLGMTERDDGTTQVTYKGQPLYYYAHEAPGEVTCHDVDEFGGLWLAIDAEGNSV
jgi:predicted lipoprotein with Yx(FWY)xxD motif